MPPTGLRPDPGLPLVKEIETNTGSLPKEASADAGYFSANAIEGRHVLGVDPFIPPDKIRHGVVLPPAARGRIPSHRSSADRMRRKLRTKKGPEALRPENGDGGASLRRDQTESWLPAVPTAGT